MKARFAVTVLLITIMVMFAIATMDQANAASEKSVKIGIIFPMSGPMALLGGESFAAAEIAKEIVNERGGVLGKKVEYVVADAPDATAANTEATRLIIKEGVKLLMGTYSSSLCIAASEVAEREGVIYWELIAVADKITNRGYKNIVRLNFSSSMQGETAANFAKFVADKLGIRPNEFRVAIVSEDSDFGMSVGDGAIAKAKEIGLKLVGDERYSKNLTDFSSMVLKLKAANPHALIATSYLNDGITIWRQARELDLNLKAMIGIGQGYGLPDFIKAHGDNGNGVFSVDPPIKQKVEGFLQNTQKLYPVFLSRFKEKMKRDPGALALVSFSGAWTLMTEVLPKTGSVDPNKIRKVAHALDLPMGYYLTGGGVKLNDKGQNIRALVGVNQWQNKELQVAWPDNLATAKPIMIPLPKWSERR